MKNHFICNHCGGSTASALRHVCKIKIETAEGAEVLGVSLPLCSKCQKTLASAVYALAFPRRTLAALKAGEGK